MSMNREDQLALEVSQECEVAKNGKTKKKIPKGINTKTLLETLKRLAVKATVEDGYIIATNTLHNFNPEDTL